jgi:hypothetical protein
MREQLFEEFRALEIKDCPFVNLPERQSPRAAPSIMAMTATRASATCAAKVPCTVVAGSPPGKAANIRAQ